ncbi:MAG: hypothetical protein JO314_06395, partial [Acidobacteria bacterium]|nr:hypothetical protein [Acidobacteriota bacterium]
MKALTQLLICGVVLFGAYAVSAQTDLSTQTIKLWDVTTGQEMPAVFKDQGDVTAMALSPDGQFVAAADEYKSINVWDVKEQKLVGKLVGHTQYVKEVSYHP